MDFVAVFKIHKHFIENSKIGFENWVTKNWQVAVAHIWPAFTDLVALNSAGGILRGIHEILRRAGPAARFQLLTFAKIPISVPYPTSKWWQIFLNYAVHEDLSCFTTDFTCIRRDIINLRIVLIWLEPFEAIILVYVKCHCQSYWTDIDSDLYCWPITFLNDSIIFFGETSFRFIYKLKKVENRVSNWQYTCISEIM